MRERFAAAVAGGGHAHQPRVVGVLHVAGEHAVLDQRGAAGRRAFVVDVERTAAARQGAVVDDGDARRRHALAHAAGVRRGALAVEIAFQAVTDRFVQQHARPTIAQHHRHRAGRRVDRVQIHQRLAQGFLAAALRTVTAKQFGVVVTSAVAGTGRFATAVLLHDHLGVEAHERPDVACHHAVAAGDKDGVDRGAQRHRNLAHARVGGAQQSVDAAHRIEFRGVVVSVDRIGGGVQRLGRSRAGAGQRGRGAAVAVAGDGFRGARSREQRVSVDFVGIRETGLFAGDRPHADALIDRVRAVLDDAVLHRPAFAARMLEIEVAEIDARPQQQAETAFEGGIVQSGGRQQSRFGELQHRGHGDSGECIDRTGVVTGGGGINPRRVRSARTGRCVRPLPLSGLSRAR